MPPRKGTQRYVYGSVDVVVPLGAVQRLPLPQQAAVVASVFAALAACVAAAVSLLLPALDAAAPDAMAACRAAWPLWGLAYAFAGVMHFVAADAFRACMPKRGAWGFWYVPGSAWFHVAWSGVLEAVVGAALAAGALPAARAAAPELVPRCAAVLLVHTTAVSFANIYMYSHNAPTPMVGTMTPAAHAGRFALQAWLLTVEWELMHGRF